MSEPRSKIPKRVGVLLSAEAIWDVVFSLYQIDKSGYMRMAIVFNKPAGNLQEKPLLQNLSGMELADSSDVRPSALRALIITAGRADFDRLCNFEQAGEAFGVDSDFRAFIRIIYRRELPIGAFGYAVPLLVKSIQGLNKNGPVVTIGNDPKLQAGIEASGALAVSTRPTEVIIDEQNKLVTCGGQLASNRPLEVAADCENMFKAITELIKG